MPTEWALRPVSKQARDAAHTAATWKLVYFRPCLASRSKVGVRAGPPNAPTMISTLGAPSGARSRSGKSAFESIDRKSVV